MSNLCFLFLAAYWNIYPRSSICFPFCRNTKPHPDSTPGKLLHRYLRGASVRRGDPRPSSRRFRGGWQWYLGLLRPSGSLWSRLFLGPYCIFCKSTSCRWRSSLLLLRLSIACLWTWNLHKGLGYRIGSWGCNSTRLWPRRLRESGGAFDCRGGIWFYGGFWAA